MLRNTILAALLFAAGPLALAQTTWVVAADGSGDFTQIQPAIDVSMEGDVIVLKSGVYGPFAADRRLTIVGPEFLGTAPTARVTGFSQVHNTDGFTLAGIGFDRLEVREVDGVVTIDECLLNQPFNSPGGNPTLEVRAVEGLVLSRTVVIGATGDYGYDPADAKGWAVRVRSGHCSIDSSTLIGGDGKSVNGGCSGFASTGGPAIELLNADATIVNTTLEAGSGDSVCCLCTCCWKESGGIPLRAKVSRALLLGQITLVKPPGNEVLGGMVNATESEVVWATGNPPTDVKLFSGATFTTAADGVWLTVLGNDGLGQSRTVRVAAPTGAPGVLALGLPGAPSDLVGFAPALWIALGQPTFLAPIVGAGSPSTVLTITLPATPALVGAQLLCQAAFPTVANPLDPQSASLSNPASIVPRF